MNWHGPWNYADAESTAARLRAAGFDDIETWLEPKSVTPADPRAFIQTVCVVRHLDRLPDDLKGPFVDRVLADAGEPFVLDYVRLNMTARRRSEVVYGAAAMTRTIALLPGDGIGPEILAPAVELLNTVVPGEFEYQEHVFGGAAIDAHGTALTEDTLEACRRADAVLLAAVGGPKWDTTDPTKPRPEQGLLGLRKGLGLFANLRPVRPVPALYDASPLRREIIDGHRPARRPRADRRDLLR